jgi:hypothetical protein
MATASVESGNVSGSPVFVWLYSRSLVPFTPFTLSQVRAFTSEYRRPEKAEKRNAAFVSRLLHGVAASFSSSSSVRYSRRVACFLIETSRAGFLERIPSLTACWQAVLIRAR